MRSLPRTKTSAGFTSEVMRKVQAGERRAPFVWRMAAALAMVFCFAVIVQITLVQQAQRRKYADLRAEGQKIQADLQAVKKIAEDTEPVVVLENDHGTRVIVDLDSAIQPASLKTYD
jgi:hypothetical protein